MDPRGLGRARAKRFAATALALAVLAGLGLLLRLVFYRGSYLPVEPFPTTPVIDLHCHTAGLGAGESGCFVSPAMRSNIRFRIYLRAFGVTEEELERHGDDLLPDRIAAALSRSRHVQAAVLLALDGVVGTDGELDRARTEVYIPNTFVAAAARRHPELLFGASINPHRRDALERLDACARDGAVLVKWIPSIMHIDPADPAHEAFYRRLKDHGLVLLSHTGPERSFTDSRDELADPIRLRRALELGVTVIAAHAAAGSTAGAGGLGTLRDLMREFPNLYADISALTQVNRLGALRDTLADASLRDRLVYGSDFPLINTALVSPWYFPLNLPESRLRAMAALENPWDRDLELKQALGVPAEVFARTATLLRLRDPRPGPANR